MARDGIRTRNLRCDRPALYQIELPGLLQAGDRTRTGDTYLGKVLLYQLSYSRTTYAWTDSNCPPPPPQGGALPTELQEHYILLYYTGLAGLEPATRRLRAVCSNQLSYLGFSNSKHSIFVNFLRGLQIS